MGKPSIAKEEFVQRLQRIREEMKKQEVQAIFIYGDEFRRENLRYMSNYWPIFDRGAFIATLEGEPIVLTAPETIALAKEMCRWQDLRNVPDMCAGYVDDTIDYPFADYYSLRQIADEVKQRAEIKRVGVVGLDAMCYDLYKALKKAFSGCELVCMDKTLYKIREVKSQAELECMRESGRIASAGIEALLATNLVGMTETEACGIAEAAARKEGSEYTVFTICATGERSNYVVPRCSTKKIIEDGDMVMFGLAVMYEGYITTCQVPFAVGNYSKETWKINDALIRAWGIAMKELRPGNKMKNLVTSVRDLFRAEGYEKYDLYPPMHGAGLAEAENPYPDENTERVFEPGMCFNTDISLFGTPANSNRIEGGYIVTEGGYESITPIVDEYCSKWLETRSQSEFCDD